MFDFSLDQVVTYLLIAASSSAVTRIDDWLSNWGRDKFPDMASASVAMSFLSFAALAFSSLISGYGRLWPSAPSYLAMYYANPDQHGHVQCLGLFVCHPLV